MTFDLTDAIAQVKAVMCEADIHMERTIKFNLPAVKCLISKPALRVKTGKQELAQAGYYFFDACWEDSTADDVARHLNKAFEIAVQRLNELDAEVEGA